MTLLKNKLSYYLRQVKNGETIEIIEHSVPVARIEAITHGESKGHDLLGRLSRDGIITPAREIRATELLKKRPLKSKVDPVKLLVEERGDR